ncbi:membrane protein [Paramyrothecium foliicola]|nr:membrane protein [Paramyrothecium foliicola]
MAEQKEPDLAAQAADSQPKPGPAVVGQDVDDFGLPTRQLVVTQTESTQDDSDNHNEKPASPQLKELPKNEVAPSTDKPQDEKTADLEKRSVNHEEDGSFETPPETPSNIAEHHKKDAAKSTDSVIGKESKATIGPSPEDPAQATSEVDGKQPQPEPATAGDLPASQKPLGSNSQGTDKAAEFKAVHARSTSTGSALNDGGASGFSHQQLSTKKEEKDDDDDGGWQEMPSYARYDMYDDDDRLVAREYNEDEIEKYGYGGLGGAGKGYTRVLHDDDADSTNSMDENTQYLFKEGKGTSMVDDEDARDALSQMQATKDLLTEGQRIAYVGIVRLEIANMVKEADALEAISRVKKEIKTSSEAMRMWGQKMMIRLYTHMDISEAEQIMIEQLAEHGVRPEDLTPALQVNSRVRNPMAAEGAPESPASPADKAVVSTRSNSPSSDVEEAAPPPYEQHEGEELPQVKTPSQLPNTQKIDIDLRWTVLCDLFLILVADSIYDARSRILLERVAKSLDINWIDICKFEKRVTDALEIQQAAEKENWNEDTHLEHRRKAALTRRYVMMGLATVGGGLVIGLSAGLMAPVIGGGIAAVVGAASTTGTFFSGVGGIALITSGAATTGSFIGGKAANRRTGSVQTFEYRPLHNNKRVNLIVTVSGWLTGKVDDVRLPFSTVDPIMGDIYSVLWEPELLRSMGDTINIIATEALTQGLQGILGSTVLMTLMAGLQIPLILTKLSYLIDNPWSVSLDRATAAGLILADSLIERSLGARPITLVGYSLGSRVIFSCLQELARKGAYGLVQNVYLFGSPIVVKKHQYLRARTVVSGRFVNGYHRNDWILGYLFRLTSGGIRRIAGLAPIDDLPWIENMDVTELVPGHLEYRSAIPSLLLHCGWSVESEEFTEIEDPDPENHKDRQRELINEIEEARRELEREGKAGKKKGFSLFGRRRKGDKQEWEVYEDTAGKTAKSEKPGGGNSAEPESNRGVLFDVDAIRAELAKEARNGDGEELQVREIKSTLPPMKLDLSSPPLTATADQRGSLRETRSVETLPMRFSKDVRSTSLHVTPSQSRSRSPSAWDYGTEKHDDDIQMTFDTSFDNDSSNSKKPSPLDKDDAAARPEMKTSKTLPNLTLSDPWGDPDDDDFGKEKEISMTFA